MLHMDVDIPELFLSKPGSRKGPVHDLPGTTMWYARWNPRSDPCRSHGSKLAVAALKPWDLFFFEFSLWLMDLMPLVDLFGFVVSC